MKRQYEDIDRLIESALSQEEADFYHQLDEQSLHEMVGGLFQGKLKWINIMTIAIMVILFVLAIWCLVRFINADDPVVLIKWGAAVFGCMMAVGMLKLYNWMQMDKNALLREIKRLEYQITVMARKVAD
ncbi:MAG: DUF6768 family protein [Saprospiraceae bacterium]|nr:DUF6768 family protein [Saprospiraceae bacterium]